ncbi:MAG: HD domain-containing protein [Firmicutes bacterium]|nr:HD domain-containing protein [Bacillota bacterium]
MGDYDEAGVTIRRSGQAAESVQLKGLRVSLLAAGNGTEIILHTLEAGTSWAMLPESGWYALECLMLLKGRLLWMRDEGDVLLLPGDTLSAQPVRKHCLFTALEHTEFLYASSEPVFHLYSGQLHNMRQLAVSVEEQDGYTADHCQRIMDLSMMVASRMNLTSSQLYELNLGSFLHDVGKVRVPRSILGKPGALTEDEWIVMRQHTIFGRQMLAETGLPFLIPVGAIVEQHHERYNGKGYPYGLADAAICTGAAIVAVVDSYDAMTSDRVYRPGLPKDEAIEEILRCRDTLYRPDVVDAFLDVADEV